MGLLIEWRDETIGLIRFTEVYLEKGNAVEVKTALAKEHAIETSQVTIIRIT